MQEYEAGRQEARKALRHEVAPLIVTRLKDDVTGCPITRTLRG